MIRTIFCLVLGTLALAAVPRIFNKDTQPVALVSTPVEAEVWIEGKRFGVTPLSLDLNNHQSHMVTFRKDGHEEVTCQLTASVGAIWIVLDVFGGLAPVVVDAATGAWKSLDQVSCNVNLPKIGGLAAWDKTARCSSFTTPDGLYTMPILSGFPWIERNKDTMSLLSPATVSARRRVQLPCGFDEIDLNGPSVA